jgi:hypothetical protein
MAIRGRSAPGAIQSNRASAGHPASSEIEQARRSTDHILADPIMGQEAEAEAWPWSGELEPRLVRATDGPQTDSEPHQISGWTAA